MREILAGGFALVVCLHSATQAQYLQLDRSVTTPPGGSRAIGDFNGDGLIDWAVIDSSTGQHVLNVILSVREAVPTALTTTLADPPGLSLGVGLRIIPFHYDSDPFHDLIVVDGSGRIVVYSSAGNGTFSFSGVNSVLSLSVIQVFSTEDIDGDGDDDLVVSSRLPGFQFGEVVRVIENGASGWTIIEEFVARMNLIAVLVADFSGDGLPDLAYSYGAVGSFVTTVTRRHVVFREQLPGGSFGPEIWNLFSNLLPRLAGGREVTPLAAGDVDDDGKSELLFLDRSAVSQLLPTDIRVAFIGPGMTSASFSTVDTYNLQTGTAGIQIFGPSFGDLSGDGYLDVSYAIAPCSGVPSCGIQWTTWEYRGARQFEPSPQSLAYTGTGVMAEHYFRDFDDDGDSDFIHVSLPGSSPGFLISSFTNRARTQTACISPGFSPPALTCTAARLGDVLNLRVSEARPNAIGLIGVSLAPTNPLPTGCGIGVSGQDLLIPTSSGFGMLQTDSLGVAALPVWIPPSIVPVGTEFWAQAAVLDPNGTLLASGQSIAVTDTRLLIVR